MPTKPEIDFQSLQDLYWHPMGQASLSGDLLELFGKLDKHFQDWGKRWKAKEHMFPPFLSVKQMDKLDYFKSFPHLITVPVVLNGETENLKRFSESPTNPDQSLALPELAPVQQVLTPAACYHFYDELENSNFADTKYLTTCCVCYRREKEYSPLQRQWAFSMREIVCLGTADQVKSYLEEFEQILSDFFEKSSLPVKFEYATDPFFNPSTNPKYLLQKLDPVKKEMIYDGHLSIGSLNFHRNFFGDNFSIRVNSEPAFSACVAFGIERWIYMILRERGLKPEDWNF